MMGGLELPVTAGAAKVSPDYKNNEHVVKKSTSPAADTVMTASFSLETSSQSDDDDDVDMMEEKVALCAKAVSPVVPRRLATTCTPQSSTHSSTRQHGVTGDEEVSPLPSISVDYGVSEDDDDDDDDDCTDDDDDDNNNNNNNNTENHHSRLQQENERLLRQLRRVEAECDALKAEVKRNKAQRKQQQQLMMRCSPPTSPNESCTRRLMRSLSSGEGAAAVGGLHQRRKQQQQSQQPTLHSQSSHLPLGRPPFSGGGGLSEHDEHDLEALLDGGSMSSHSINDTSHHHNHHHPDNNNSKEVAAAAAVNKFGETEQPFWEAVWDRSGWLVGLLVLQSLSSFIISRNELLLQKHLVIVQFLTMLVGAGGNAGNQSSVRVVRGLALGTIHDGNSLDFLKEEVKMGVTLATILGVAGCVRAAVFLVPVAETIAITVSLYSIVWISIFLGALLPLLMKYGGIDPANSSTTIQVIMDILGVTITVHVAAFVLDSNFATWLTGGGSSGSG